MVPRVKILWILRDPLQRAVSQYWHAARKGVETKPLDEAFASELRGETHNVWRRYLHRSCYKEQIERYLAFFPSEQIHFVDFNAFISDNVTEKEKISHFLEIQPLDADVPHSNKTKFYPRSRIIRQLTSIPLPQRLRQYLMRVSGYKKSAQPTLSNSTRIEAERFLDEKNSGLDNLIGFSL